MEEGALQAVPLHLGPGDGLRACLDAAAAAPGPSPEAEVFGMLNRLLWNPPRKMVTAADLAADVADRRALARCGADTLHSALSDRDADLCRSRDRIRRELYAEYGHRLNAMRAQELERRAGSPPPPRPDPGPPLIDTELRREMHKLQQESLELLQRELRESHAPLEVVQERLAILLGLQQGKVPQLPYLPASLRDNAGASPR
eukprot:TRINITY_DN56039_c0_g1_i1.p1 TRINITY_DN56039_c0_g1~~TRINITY_DN56039_c0_g1_i1.p1  ORF type:complete len:202 (+),score=57.38 TRINITY_DN56039_c0_g1_i1:88-693(+)